MLEMAMMLAQEVPNYGNDRYRYRHGSGDRWGRYWHWPDRWFGGRSDCSTA